MLIKKILLIILSLLICFSVQAKEWKNKNKWKISCGVVNKESLIVNGKSKKYSKNEFKLEDVVFKLDKGDIGTVQFRFEDKDNGRARTQALKKCFTKGYDDCEVSLTGVTK